MILIEELESQMEELAKFAVPGRNHDDSKQQEFYKVQKLYRAEKERLNAQKKEACIVLYEASKVNGFGEATHREITSSTYKRAQKRLNKKVESFLR